MSASVRAGADRAPVVLLGYGSIGRRHAAAFTGRGHRLAIVNRGETTRRRAAAEHPGATVVATLADLDQAGYPIAESLGVIATWGPGHAEHLADLSSRGVGRVLCEKPMAASVADARAMTRHARDARIFLALNHTLRYAGLANALRRLADQHELGDPVAVVVSGGAACLLTNGLHWLDFAVELFGAAPESVVSTAAPERINPRAPNLVMVGGTAVWAFSDGREAVVSFTNRASVLPAARVLYRNAAIDAGYRGAGDDAVLYGCVRVRDRDAVARFPQVTRTGAVSQVLHDGPLPGVRTFNEGLLAAAKELAESDEPTCGGAEGAVAVECCLGALESARSGRRIAIRPDADAPWHGDRWPIS